MMGLKPLQAILSVVFPVVNLGVTIASMAYPFRLTIELPAT